MKYKATAASRQGKQTAWQCSYCGSVIASTRGKPSAECPACRNSNQWLSQELPVAVFESF